MASAPEELKDFLAERRAKAETRIEIPESTQKREGFLDKVRRSLAQIARQPVHEDEYPSISPSFEDGKNIRAALAQDRGERKTEILSKDEIDEAAAENKGRAA